MQEKQYNLLSKREFLKLAAATGGATLAAVVLKYSPSIEPARTTTPAEPGESLNLETGYEYVDLTSLGTYEEIAVQRNEVYKRLGNIKKSPTDRVLEVFVAESNVESFRNEGAEFNDYVERHLGKINQVMSDNNLLNRAIPLQIVVVKDSIANQMKADSGHKLISFSSPPDWITHFWAFESNYDPLPLPYFIGSDLNDGIDAGLVHQLLVQLMFIQPGWMEDRHKNNTTVLSLRSNGDPLPYEYFMRPPRTEYWNTLGQGEDGYVLSNYSRLLIGEMNKMGFTTFGRDGSDEQAYDYWVHKMNNTIGDVKLPQTYSEGDKARIFVGKVNSWENWRSHVEFDEQPDFEFTVSENGVVELPSELIKGNGYTATIKKPWEGGSQDIGIGKNVVVVIESPDGQITDVQHLTSQDLLEIQWMTEKTEQTLHN